MAMTTNLRYNSRWTFYLILFFSGNTTVNVKCAEIWYDVGVNEDDYFETTVLLPSMWWESANDCTDMDGHLSIGHSSANSYMDRRKYYWVGAVQSSSWIWTSDQTSLFTYAGYYDAPYVESIDIDGNSPLKCHLHCWEEGFSTFALQLDECYCVSSLSFTSGPIKPTGSIVRCSGSYAEECGNDFGVSVYKLDSIDITPKEDGECVYVSKGKKQKGKKQTIAYFQDNDCNNARGFACGATKGYCSEKVCIVNQRKTWTLSNNTCSLLKITDSTEKKLLKLLPKQRVQTYWIGLKRKHTWHWLNGTHVKKEYKNKFVGETCLAAFLNQTAMGYIWQPCDREYPALCNTVGVRFPVLPTTASPTTAETSTETTGTTVMSTGTIYGSIDMLTNETGTDVAPMTESDNTGAYVGAVLACLISLIVVATCVLLTRRNKKLCFAMTTTEQKTKVAYVNSLAESCLDDPYYSTLSLSRDSSIPSAKPSLHRTDVIQSNIHCSKPENESYYAVPEENNATYTSQSSMEERENSSSVDVPIGRIQNRALVNEYNHTYKANIDEQQYDVLSASCINHGTSVPRQDCVMDNRLPFSVPNHLSTVLMNREDSPIVDGCIQSGPYTEPYYQVEHYYTTLVGDGESLKSTDKTVTQEACHTKIDTINTTEQHDLSEQVPSVSHMYHSLEHAIDKNKPVEDKATVANQEKVAERLELTSSQTSRIVDGNHARVEDNIVYDLAINHRTSPLELCDGNHLLQDQVVDSSIHCQEDRNEDQGNSSCYDVASQFKSQGFGSPTQFRTPKLVSHTYSVAEVVKDESVSVASACKENLNHNLYEPIDIVDDSTYYNTKCEACNVVDNIYSEASC